MIILTPRYPDAIWGDRDPRNEQQNLARSKGASRYRRRRRTRVEAVAAAKWSRTYVNKYIYTYTEAGNVGEERRHRGRISFEVVTYVRNKYQVHTYRYNYVTGTKVVLIFLSAGSKEGSRHRRLRNMNNKSKVERVAAAKWVRTIYIYIYIPGTRYILYTCIYTGMHCRLFSVRGARKEPDTVGDQI